MQNIEVFMNALMNDKKKINGSINYIVPDDSGARIVSSDVIPDTLLRKIIGNA
jgi:3-dehydroquinate synthetase